MEQTSQQRKLRGAWRLYEAAVRMADRLPGHLVRNDLEDVRVFDGYAEPGYDAEVVAIGNWNVVDEYDREKRERVPVEGGYLIKRLGDAFERIGVEIEWSDEWRECDDCNRIVRVQPDSHGWEPHYHDTSDGLSCSDCFAKYHEEAEEDEEEDEEEDA